MKGILIALLAVAVVGGILFSGCVAPPPEPPPEAPDTAPEPSAPETVTFPDEDLETAIRDALGKPAGEVITPAELAGLTELDAGGTWGAVDGIDWFSWGIGDLSGIEYCTNLTYLNLPGNPISDISPVASLTNLTKLGLYDNQISDLSPLASLTNLTYLGLDYNQISDLSPLVENSGLGAGDKVSIWENNLDLSEGSEDLENIRQLEGRGVKVHY